MLLLFHLHFVLRAESSFKSSNGKARIYTGILLITLEGFPDLFYDFIFTTTPSDDWRRSNNRYVNERFET